MHKRNTFSNGATMNGKKISNTGESQEDLRKIYNPDGSQLRKAQLRMLEMLKFLDKICTENNITYWLDSGTLLGAARHGGFIPWDDDTDICMPLKDAERFKKLMLTQHLSDDFVLQCRETDDGYYGAWYVLRDTKSEYMQNSKLHQKRKYRGLQIDIFMVEEKSFYPFFWFAEKVQRNLIDKHLYKNDYWSQTKWGLVLVYHIQQLLILLFRLISPKRDFIRMPYGVLWKKRNIKDIFPLRKIMFEGHEFNAPSNTENYLTSIYGEWEKLPDKIQTHNVEVVFL